MPQPEGPSSVKKLAVADVERGAVDGGEVAEALRDLEDRDVQGFFQVASMSDRYFFLRPSERFAAMASS